MKAAEEIQQIKDLIKYFHLEGICPNINALNHLFDNKTEGYLKAMESLGQIEIKDGKIVDLIEIRG